MTLFVDNSGVAELRNLRDSITGVLDDSASVALTIFDADGAEVAGETWPVSMTSTGAGLYRRLLPASLVLSAKAKYTALAVATSSTGAIGSWRCQVIAEDRRCC